MKVKNRFALVFQDYLSKWPEVYAVVDRTAQTVAKCLADVINFTDIGYHQQLFMTAPQNSCPTYYKIQLLFSESSNYQLL